MAAGDGAGREVVAVLGHVQGVFIHCNVSILPGDHLAVVDVDGNGRGALIAVSIADGVDKHIGSTSRCIAVRVGVINAVTFGIQRDVAIGALDIDAQLSRGWRGGIGAGTHANYIAAIGQVIGANHIIGQHVAADLTACLDSGEVAVSLRHIIDDGYIEAASGGTAVGVLGNDREAFLQPIGAVAIGVSLVVEQGIGVADHPCRRVVAGDGEGVAQRGSDRLREACGYAATDYVDAADAQRLQAIRRNHREGAALLQSRAVNCAAIDQVFLVNGNLASAHVEAAKCYRVIEVADVQGQGRTAGVTVSVFDGVGEGLDTIATAGKAFEVGIVNVEGVGVGAIRSQHQRAVGTSEGAGNHRATHDPVSALYVIAEDIAAEFHLLFCGRYRVGVIHRLGHIVDNAHVKVGRGSAAIAVLGCHDKCFAQAVVAVAGDVGFIVEQRVAVAHHACGRVVAGDGQCVTQRGRDRLRETACCAAADYCDAAHAQALQAIWRGNGKGPVLRQRSAVWRAAIDQILFIDNQLTTGDIQPADRHWVAEIADVQRQGRAAGIAVGVSDGVGKALGAPAATFEPFEIRVIGVEGIGVGTVSSQHQCAVGAAEGTGNHRPADDPVGALHIVVEYVAGQLKLLLGGCHCVAVIHRFGHIVTNDHVEAAAGYIAIAVADLHRELLADQVAAATVGVLLSAVKGVAVIDHAGRRVVAGDGQGVPKGGGDGLANTGNHPAGDYVDATYAEIEHAIGGDNGERALLGQRRRVAVGAVGQVGLVEEQFAGADIKALQGDRVVWRIHRRWGRGRQHIVGTGRIEVTNVAIDQQRHTVEARSREANRRVYAIGNFSQHDKAVAAAQSAWGTSIGPSRGSLGLFTRVGTRSDGLLQALDIGQLRLAGGDVVGQHMGGLISQQLWRHLQAAVAAQGQLCAVVQAHRNGSGVTGFELFASIESVAFDQQAAAAVAVDRENLADHLADHSDKFSHALRLPCRTDPAA